MSARACPVCTQPMWPVGECYRDYELRGLWCADMEAWSAYWPDGKAEAK